MSQASLSGERRSRGILLLLLALAIAVAAYVLVGLGKRGRVPVDLALYGSIFVVGYGAAWALVRRVARAADPALLPAAAALTGLGFAVIFRLSGDLAAEQATWLVV